jgi:hypothetical protein
MFFSDREHAMSGYGMEHSDSSSQRFGKERLRYCPACLVGILDSVFLVLLTSSRWDAITLHYQRTDAPMRLTLEMRLTGSSEILLAPLLNNTLGTASIEVLTTSATPEEAWGSFQQQITDRWTSYRSATPGGPYLNARPHWAKEWQGLTVRGKPIETYLREDAYKEERAP